MSIYDYLPPYHGELSGRNRWVLLADAIDWDQFEKSYSELFAPGGKAAIPARIALGCRIIQLHYRVSDREVVALVQESPYLQYFLGMETFSNQHALFGAHGGPVPGTHPRQGGAPGGQTAAQFPLKSKSKKYIEVLWNFSRCAVGCLERQRQNAALSCTWRTC